MGAPTLVAIRRTQGKGSEADILCGQCFRKYHVSAKDNQELMWEGMVTVRERRSTGIWDEVTYETLYDSEVGKSGLDCDNCGETLIEGVGE